MNAPAPSPELECRLVRVEGRVQGVGYREACINEARRLHLAGWVRNRLDGSVQVMLQGPADDVARMLAWLHEGPPHARVSRVSAAFAAAPVPPIVGFERAPTA